MKQKRADRLLWSRVPHKRFAMTHLETNVFTGYVTLVSLDEVIEPLIISRPERKTVCLADKGYRWLQHFPRGMHYALTTIFDAQGEIASWYLDICKRHWLDEQGILWYEDLYLDLDITPDGDIYILDADELDAALQQGQVSTLEYDLAWRVLDQVMTVIEADRFPLLWMGEEHLSLLTKALPGAEKDTE